MTKTAKAKADPKPPGRPTLFNIWVAYEICERIATTPRGLDFICQQDEALPGARTVATWLANPTNEGFRQSYVRARERQADLLGDESLEIADDDTRDWSPVLDTTTGALIGIKVDGEHVHRSKLRIETRLKLAAQLHPKKWGTKSTTELTGVDGKDLALSDHEAAAKLSAILEAVRARIA